MDVFSFGTSTRLTRSGRSYKSVRDVGTRGLVRYLILLGVLGMIVGCGPQDVSPKASHFEHDHEVAPHWPSDLSDASAKIHERLVWIENGDVPETHPHDERNLDPTSEIVDLVSWVPEVAADTNLSEADWLPLYHASESLLANLRAAKNGLSRDTRSQIESLCQLIDNTVPKIPEQLASLKGTSP